MRQTAQVIAKIQKLIESDKFLSKQMKLLKTGVIKSISQEINNGGIYFIIHLLLKHIAILGSN